MRAVQYSAVGEAARLVRLARPVAPPLGALLKVRATGVCRSDWHAWQGHDPVRLPHVPGHEFVGEIVEIGSQVTGFSIGERVTAPFVCGCGCCAYCAAGQAQVCPDQTQPGFTGPGSFADYVVVQGADTNLVRVPDRLGDVPAAALGCRFATAYRALTAHGRVLPGQWVSVHGCGGAGLSAVMIAHALGARVLAVDVNAAALHLAAQLGASDTLDATGLDPVTLGAQLHDRCHGGAHVSLDAVGSPEVLNAAVRGLRRRGRHVQVGLLLGAQAMSPLPMDLVVARELEVYGSHGMPAADYPPMLALAAGLDLSQLVGRVIGLEEAPAALMAMGEPSDRPGMTVISLR